MEIPREVEALKLEELPKEKQKCVEKALDLTPLRANLLAAAKAAPGTTKANGELLGEAVGLMAEAS